jgi:hypothetical protein
MTNAIHKIFVYAATALALAIPATAQVSVFQGSGPNAASLQSVVTEFRNALGANNGIAVTGQPPIATGRREINWDGAGGASTATSLGATPLDQFLEGRGTRFTTPGTGFVQAPASGLATVFGNPSYETIFKPFSNARLFAAVGSNITDVYFFVPGGGEVPAATRGFGVVFTDVDLPDGSGPGEKRGNRHDSTLVEYYDASGNLLYSGFGAASPGDGSLSFLGVIVANPTVARVRIYSGNATPGVDDDGKADVVMMDDFIYGEPQRLQ